MLLEVEAKTAGEAAVEEGPLNIIRALLGIHDLLSRSALEREATVGRTKLVRWGRILTKNVYVDWSPRF